MKKLSSTRWFRMLQANSAALAKVRGVSYPSDEPAVNATIHAEVEALLGKELKRAVEKET